MNTATVSIEQQAKITAIRGNVQLVRDGFFLPAQVGLVLLPGDRVVSDLAGKAVIQFTGLKDALIVEKGAAATFNLEVVEMDQTPQWIATDLRGEGVYFESQPAVAETGSDSGLFGLFGTPGSAAETTAYPVLESIVFLGATAAIYSDNENNDTPETTTESGTTPPVVNPEPNPEPNPNPGEPAPQAGPLDAVLTPVGDLLDGLLGGLGGNSPLGSQTLPTQANPPFDAFNLINLV